MSDIDYEFFDFMPWMAKFEHDDVQAAVLQRSLMQQARISARRNVTFGPRVHIASTAVLLARAGEAAIRVGAGSYVAAHARIYNNVVIGENCSVNTYCMLDGGNAGITIGNDTRIACNASMFAFNHVIADPDTPFRLQGVESKGIHIGSDVGVGNKAIILDGVTLGDRSFVAAGSVVTRSVAPGVIVAGNPARPIGRRGEDS